MHPSFTSSAAAMISDELRKALEKLNQGPLKAQSRPARSPARATPSVTIGEIAPARILEVPEGACVLFERTLESFFDDPEPVMRPFRDVFLKGCHGSDLVHGPSPWPEVLCAEVGAITFLDIETLGLAGMPVFLVGLINWQQGQLVIRQYFARDYSEEAAMLAAVGRAMEGSECLVTFNGKTFDVPTLNDRLAAHLLERLGIGPHLDLLHECRRRFRKLLPNCKLQTLEYHICRRRRTGDVPGELIPAVYHDFVATGEASGIRDILHHNALDLVAMVEILSFIAGGGELVWAE
jgi:uncharacterized protein YprB with RNaseH-like and TPR domain